MVAVLRTLEPERAKETLALRVGEPAQLGAPPCACRGRSQQVGKGVAMVAPPLAHHSTMGFCFYSGPVFFQKHSWLWSSLLLSL